MSEDIVPRLRAVLNHDRAVELISREAADEIEWLRNALETTQSAYADASLHRDRMRFQRDEARVEVCELRTDIGFSRPIGSHLLEFAASRGWDCFRRELDSQ